MAEKKEKNTPAVDEKHDRTLTLMIGVLIVLIATAAIAIACIYNLNNL